MTSRPYTPWTAIAMWLAIVGTVFMVITDSKWWLLPFFVVAIGRLAALIWQDR